MRMPLLRFGLGSLLAMMAVPVVVANGGGTRVIDPVADADMLASRPNINQTPVGTSGKWTMEKLNALTQAEGIALWRTLPAPTLEEMNGHYTGMGPGADDPAYQKGYADFMFNEKSVRGYWLGKAFRPLTATTGEGYNRWRFPGGRIERNLRMATGIRASIIDGKPAYVLDYGAFNKTTLFDEIRKLEDGIYIGTATVARPDGTRSKLDMFILVGPTDEWVGAPYTLGATPLKEGTQLRIKLLSDICTSCCAPPRSPMTTRAATRRRRSTTMRRPSWEAAFRTSLTTTTGIRPSSRE